MNSDLCPLRQKLIDVFSSALAERELASEAFAVGLDWTEEQGRLLLTDPTVIPGAKLMAAAKALGIYSAVLEIIVNDERV